MLSTAHQSDRELPGHRWLSRTDPSLTKACPITTDCPELNPQLLLLLLLLNYFGLTGVCHKADSLSRAPQHRHHTPTVHAHSTEAQKANPSAARRPAKPDQPQPLHRLQPRAGRLLAGCRHLSRTSDRPKTLTRRRFMYSYQSRAGQTTADHVSAAGIICCPVRAFVVEALQHRASPEHGKNGHTSNGMSVEDKPEQIKSLHASLSG